MAYQLFRIACEYREILFRADLEGASSPVEVRRDGRWVPTKLTTPDCGTDPMQIATAIGELQETFLEEGEEWSVCAIDDPTKVWGESEPIKDGVVHRFLHDGSFGVAGTPDKFDWFVTDSSGDPVQSVGDVFGDLTESQATMLAELLAAEQAMMHHRQSGEVAFKEGQ